MVIEGTLPWRIGEINSLTNGHDGYGDYHKVRGRKGTRNEGERDGRSSEELV